jgi:o-succinylbenzoate---CoA ligase
MPHARLQIDEEGRVCIAAESLFRGYFPELRKEGDFVTEDLGRIDDVGRLHLAGRRDAVIITGGKKVQPTEVEAVLRSSGEFDDIAVIGIPDADWGEVVVACYPTGTRPPDTVRASAGLAAHQRPKRFVALAEWPRTAQGKINREALAALVNK